MRISVAWLTHLKKENQAKFKETVIAALGDPVFARLRSLITQRFDTLTTTDEDFESPSWAHKRAFQDGKRLAYTEILQLMGTTNE